MYNKEDFNYLISIDMDGTLLDDNKEIDDETISFLSSLKDKKVLVTIASGRPYRAIKKYYDKLNLVSPIICYNGAYVFSPLHKEFPKTRYMFSHRELLKIINSVGFDRFDNIMIENDTKIYIKHADEHLDSFFHFANMELHTGNFLDQLDDSYYTCIFETKDEKVRNDLVKATFQTSKIGLRFWGSSAYCELYYLNVNKGNAVENVRKYFNIPKDNVISVGDAENDIEMLREAKYSILMKNTHVKEDWSNFITKVSDHDNNNKGVLNELKKLLTELKII